MSEILICPICKTGLKQKSSIQAGGAARIDCPNCSYYILDYIFYADYIETGRLDAPKCATLSYAIRRMQGRGSSPPHVVEKLALDVLQNTTLPAAAEQLDNLVIFIGQELTEPGQRHHFDIKTMKAPTKEEFIHFLQQFQ